MTFFVGLFSLNFKFYLNKSDDVYQGYDLFLTLP